MKTIILKTEQISFSLLKSFAETNGTPVHLLLFPEAWSLHDTRQTSKAVLAKSNEFAKTRRETSAETFAATKNYGLQCIVRKSQRIQSSCV